MKFRTTYIVILLYLFSGCGNGDDGPQTYYAYYGVICFTDTNEIIQRIYYPEAGVSDTPQAYRALLKISSNIPTQATVKSTHYLYDFTFKLKFSLSGAGDFEHSHLERNFESLEVLKSSAMETNVQRYLIPVYSRTYWSADYLIIDSIFIK